MQAEDWLMHPMAINRIIAHRGGAAYAPENTMTAFTTIASLGCSYIEFDVMLSADGVAFICHDLSLNRTTNGIGQVGLVDSVYLRSLDAGSWFSPRFAGEKIPYLFELLQWLNTNHIGANLEIKPYPNTAIITTETVLASIKSHWTRTDLPLVSSFNFEVLLLCHTKMSELPLGLVMDGWDPNWLIKAQSIQCYSVHVSQWALNRQRIQEIKNHGYIVLAYTVNRKHAAKRLFKLGVDAVFSDYPDLMN